MCKKCFTLICLIIVLGLATSASADLVGQWKLDEGGGTTAVDASGNGNDGTLEDDPVVVDGQFGPALEFDASRVTIAASDSLTADLFQGTFTVSAWINPSRTGNTWQQIFRSVRESDTNDTLFLNNDGRLSWRGRVGNAWAGGMCETSPDVVPAGQWTHVAVTGDGTNFRIYVNGTLSQESPFQTTDGANVTYYIGGDMNFGESYAGMVDDLRVYNHVLSEDDIRASMENQGGAVVKSYGPDPRDGAMLKANWVTLSWRAGDFALSQDVYLSDNFDDVKNGAADAFQGNQPETMLIAGFPGFPFPEGLVPGTTYYWRADGVNSEDPNSPWTGDVWSFWIQPKTAYNPDPVDGAEFVDPNAALTWTAGFGAKLHTVYMGTNFDDVNNAEGGMPLGNASYSPGPLELEKVYYWRVDEFDAISTHKGDIWSFTTPGAVGNAQPANGAADVQMISTLTWTPADNAASHELYFGADRDAVNNATAASPEYIGPRALGSESYDPELVWNSTHYWRVDEVYAGETVKGLVWSFTTADYMLVDDFESYNDIDPPDPNSNRIFDVWIDGFGTTTNGALIGNDMPPYAEQTIVHGGAQSMIYRYDNANKTSEATLTLVWPRDWTEQGVAKLSLRLRGAGANTADRIYVALNGSAVVYHDDPAATQTAGWSEWAIDLAEFAGVDLTNVNTITIGIGTQNSPAAGGSGTMYFDDIRLYQ